MNARVLEQEKNIYQQKFQFVWISNALQKRRERGATYTQSLYSKSARASSQHPAHIHIPTCFHLHAAGPSLLLPVRLLRVLPFFISPSRTLAPHLSLSLSRVLHYPSLTLDFAASAKRQNQRESNARFSPREQLPPHYTQTTDTRQFSFPVAGDRLLGCARACLSSSNKCQVNLVTS